MVDFRHLIIVVGKGDFCTDTHLLGLGGTQDVAVELQFKATVAGVGIVHVEGSPSGGGVGVDEAEDIGAAFVVVVERSVYTEIEE